MSSVRSQDRGYTWAEDNLTHWKGAQGRVRGSRKVLVLDLSAGYMVGSFYKKFWSWTLTVCVLFYMHATLQQRLHQKCSLHTLPLPFGLLRTMENTAALVPGRTPANQTEGVRAPSTHQEEAVMVTCTPRVPRKRDPEQKGHRMAYAMKYWLVIFMSTCTWWFLWMFIRRRFCKKSGSWLISGGQSWQNPGTCL